VISLPYVVRLLASALQSVNPRLEEAARTLGANTFTTFRRVTLPSVKSGVLAASLFAFLASFDEATATVLVAGAENTTLPVRIFGQVSQEYSPEIAAISTALIGMTLVAVFLVTPLIAVVKSAFDTANVVQLGFSGFTLRWFGDAIGDVVYVRALLLSLQVAALSVVVNLVIVMLAAYAIVRGTFPGRNALLGFLLSPLMLPSMVLAIGFILFFQKIGQRPSVGRLVLVHLVISLPYVVRLLASALQSVNPEKPSCTTFDVSNADLTTAISGVTRKTAMTTR
jgi:ABC-type spermidine/putrescine transport system permease subunit II